LIDYFNLYGSRTIKYANRGPRASKWRYSDSGWWTSPSRGKLIVGDAQVQEELEQAELKADKLDATK
jgi:hypothetical protein